MTPQTIRTAMLLTLPEIRRMTPVTTSEPANAAIIITRECTIIPNLYYVCKYARLPFDWKNWVGKPLLSSLVMGISIFLLRNILPLHRLWTLLEVGVGVCVYFAMALLLKIVSPEDLSSVKRVLGRRKRKGR